MQTFAAAGFEKRRQTQFIEQRLHQLRAILNIWPANAFAGIEIKGHPVRLLNRSPGGVPGMELDHVHLCRLQQRIARRNHQQWRVARVERRVKQRDAGINFASACFWKKSSPSIPDGARTKATGMSLRCVSISGATAR